MKRKTKKIIKMIKDYSFVWVTILLIIGFIVGININKNNLRDKLAFTEENYEYMYTDIVSSFGEGEEFHVVKVTEEYLESLTTVEGIEISIIGYFDSQENMYIVAYAKYLEDKPIYKNGEAGNVICIAVNANYTKEAYFNSNNNVD